MEKKAIGKETYIFIAIAVIAVLARIWAFGAVPAGVHQDGAMAAVDAKALADYGTDRFGMAWPVHLTAWGYGQMSALMTYLMAAVIKLFGMSVVTIRIPNLLLSLAGLAALYAFARDAFRSKMVALVVLAFAAINPWHIMQSRWALDCNLFPHLFMIGLYLVHKGATEKRLRFVLLSMVSFALCLYAYGIALYSVPLFLVALCAVMLCKRMIDWRGALLALGVFLLVAWPILAMVVINFFRWPSIELPFMTIPFFADSVRSRDMLFFSETPLAQLWMNAKYLVRTVVLQQEWRPWHATPGYGQMYLFSMPFAVWGFVRMVMRAIREKKENFGLLSILMALGMGVWAGLITPVTTHRINIIFYFIILLAAYGIYELCARVKHVKWAVLAAYAVAFVMFISAYFTTGAALIREWFWADMNNALTYAATVESDSYVIVQDFPEMMDGPQMAVILTAYTHQLDAEYVQSAAYAERYTFINGKNFAAVEMDATKVYIIQNAAQSVCSEADFDLVAFGEAIVAIPKEFADFAD